MRLCFSSSVGCVGQVSILLMVAGAVIAGLTDLTYSLPGYIWVSVCAVSTAVYLLLIRLLKDRTGQYLRCLPVQKKWLLHALS